ncbi:MAG: flagellar filament capping protein FliD [Chitinophagales bacterium]
MSLFRIGGLATGLDTNSMIDSLMKVERQPEDLMKRRQQIFTWRKDYWGEINTKLLAVKTSLGSLLDRTKLLTKKITSSDDSALTATAGATAAAGEYSITVNALATESQLRSGSGALGLGLGGKVNLTQAVNTDAAKLGVKITSGTFTINGVRITINSGDYLGTGNTADAKDILGKINASGAGVTATYDAATDKLVLTANAPGGDLNLGGGGDTSNFLTATSLLGAARVGDTKTSAVHLGRVNPDAPLASSNLAAAVTDDGTGNGEFLINGVKITFNAGTDSLNKVISRINNSTANVVASYDTTTDRLILRSKVTGSVSISVEEVSGKGNFLTATGLTAAAGATQTLGENASFTVSGFNDGDPITSTSNSVNNVIPGVTLNLRKADPATAITVTVEQDVQAAKNVVKDFVSKYNDAMTLIDTRLSEKTVTGKDWSQMTDAERKSGIMRGEAALVDLRIKLTTKASAQVSGFLPSMDALSDIGITTSAEKGAGGTLVLDETKLENALRNSPEMVADLFFQDANDNGKWDKDAQGVPTEQGIAVQLDYLLAQLTDTQSVIRGGVSVKAGTIPRQQDVLTGQIDDLQEQIDAFEDRMAVREQELVRQFSVMEQVVSQFQSQSTWLSGQLSKL